MDRSDYTNADYDQPHVPPATPPVIDSNADAGDAARLADDDGDSDAPGSRPAHLDRSLEDEELFPGGSPDELQPGKGGDWDEPGQTPDEVAPGQGDTDMPDSSPSEVPAQPDTQPLETPLPPD